MCICVSMSANECIYMKRFIQLQIYLANEEVQSISMTVETQRIQFAADISHSFCPKRNVFGFRSIQSHKQIKLNAVNVYYVFFSSSSSSFTFHIIQFYYLFKLIDNKRGEGIEVISSSTVINISQPNSIWVCRKFLENGILLSKWVRWERLCS